MQQSTDEIKNTVIRYQRQFIWPDFGMKAQSALKEAKVLIVGCGGLGCPVIQYLSAAGIGHFTLYDPDVIELSNLHRQTIYHLHDVGKSKAKKSGDYIRHINPEIIVDAKEELISIHNARNIISAHDMVIDCTDGFDNKFLLNDACILEKRTLIHGSVTMMEGRLLVITPDSACLRCLFSSVPTQRFQPNCQDVGVLGPVCGVIGSMMAIETIKKISASWKSSENNYFIASFDGLPSVASYQIKRNQNCVCCRSSS